MKNEELMTTLKDLLGQVLDARFTGGTRADLARVHGYADGYMRALLDAGVADQKALLSVVSEQRQQYLDQVPVYSAA
ncbi:MAG: hypothetical protein GXP55_15530 [Deltaproteobacteria bacterium]|nr:hypothetical protein [Deltaproteobacteria bacterium]